MDLATSDWGRAREASLAKCKRCIKEHSYSVFSLANQAHPINALV